MPTLASDIDNLERDIDKTGQALSSLYLELGKTGCRYHKAIGCAASNAVFEKLCQSAEEYDEITSQIEGVQNAINRINREGNEVAKSYSGIKEIDLRIQTLLSSLGAVAIEIEASGNLPAELSDCLSSAHDFESGINELIRKRDNSRGLMLTIAEHRIEKYKNSINDIFHETGKRLFAHQNILRSIQNDRINAVLDEIEMLDDNRKQYKSFLHNRQKGILPSSSLKNENSTLKELLSKQEIARDELNRNYTEYGSIIASEMDVWLDSQAPQELTDVCNRIRVEKNRLKKQSLNKDYLLAQKEIVINSNKIEQLRVQLAGLKEQRSTIDRQIAEIEGKMSALRDAIKTLEDKQTDITVKASN